jgi:hypothetical protein
MWAYEYGFSAEANALALDFQCISACKVAFKLGMSLPEPNECVPAEIVGRWSE